MEYFIKDEILEMQGIKFDINENVKDYISCYSNIERLFPFRFDINTYPEELSFLIYERFIDLFDGIQIQKNNNKFIICFSSYLDNSERKWAPRILARKIIELIKLNNEIDIRIELEETDDEDFFDMYFSINESFIFENKFNECISIVNSYIRKAELELLGLIWKGEYLTDEKLFSTEILYPLLRKIQFTDVRFTHGKKEYGKDFTFSEITKFGNLRHFGLQAKAGNISGKVNSDIDEIIGQLEDAFSMPYYEISADENRRISTFIIAISGLYTENAKEKIINKIPKHYKGSVYFLDRDKILELVERYW